MDKIIELKNRIKGINNWIENNPQVTEPNVYEIVSLNLDFALEIANYKEKYNLGDDVKLGNICRSDSNFYDCFNELNRMEQLRDINDHPFFRQPEIRFLFSTLKDQEFNASYLKLEDDISNKIKKEAITKAMSISFYIWQVKQENPDYLFDNVSEHEFLSAVNNMIKDDQRDNLLLSFRDVYKSIDANYFMKNDKQASANLSSIKTK